MTTMLFKDFPLYMYKINLTFYSSCLVRVSPLSIYMRIESFYKYIAYKYIKKKVTHNRTRNNIVTAIIVLPVIRETTVQLN